MVYVFDSAAEIARMTDQPQRANSNELQSGFKQYNQTLPEILKLTKELERRTGTAVRILAGKNISVFYKPPSYTPETQLLPDSSQGDNLMFAYYGRRLGIASQLGLPSKLSEQEFSPDEMQLLGRLVKRLGGTVEPSAAGKHRLIVDLPPKAYAEGGVKTYKFPDIPTDDMIKLYEEMPNWRPSWRTIGHRINLEHIRGSMEKQKKEGGLEEKVKILPLLPFKKTVITNPEVQYQNIAWLPPARIYIEKENGLIETDVGAIIHPLVRETIMFIASNLFGFNLPPDEAAKQIADDLGKDAIRELMGKWKERSVNQE